MSARVEFDASGGTITRCRSCNANVVWIKTEAGKSMPLSVRTARDDAEGRTWMESHFADCPNAAKHRKPKPVQGSFLDERDPGEDVG